MYTHYDFLTYTKLQTMNPNDWKVKLIKMCASKSWFVFIHFIVFFHYGVGMVLRERDEEPIVIHGEQFYIQDHESFFANFIVFFCCLCELIDGIGKYLSQKTVTQHLGGSTSEIYWNLTQIIMATGFLINRVFVVFFNVK